MFTTGKIHNNFSTTYISRIATLCQIKREQKPSLRQRHRLQASNAESRIRLIVLLTAPKIFAISLITDKNSCRNFARLSVWWFDWAGHPHPKRKSIQGVLINGICNFEDGTRAATAATAPNAELTSHTSPFCNDYNKLQSFAFWSLRSFFPHAKNCAFIL